MALPTERTSVGLRVRATPSPDIVLGIATYVRAD